MILSRRLIRYIYIIGGLSLALPGVMRGQTIKPYESKGWADALLKGSVIRSNALYMQFDEGIGNAIQFDYVNGYSYGIDMTFGAFLGTQGRHLEVSPELRYSDRRHKWSGSLELRYHLPPAYFSWVELYYRDKCIDYDNHAYSSLSNSTMGSSIAGWNGFKLYEARQIGFQGSMAIASDFQLEGGAWHERRQQVENHRLRNIFRVKGDDNTPRLRGVALDDPIHRWNSQKLWRIDAALEYTFNRRIMCYNDMRTEALPGSPVLRLGAQTGWGDINYMALDLSVSQSIGDERQTFRYFVDAGCYPVGQQEVGVIDMHHFDATHMAVQRRDNLTWFSLLSNYEMSSSHRWAEAHAEWSSCRMALTQLTNDPLLKEYVQLHFATVEGCRHHTELSYGFHLDDQIRIGCSFGWDGSRFDGVGLNIIIFNPIPGKD